MSHIDDAFPAGVWEPCEECGHPRAYHLSEMNVGDKIYASCFLRDPACGCGIRLGRAWAGWECWAGMFPRPSYEHHGGPTPVGPPTDDITGLPTLPHFEAELWKQRPHYVIITVDISRLEYLNEHLGRQSGDELLRQVPHKLQRWANNNSFSARLSRAGSTFIVVRPALTVVDRAVEYPDFLRSHVGGDRTSPMADAAPYRVDGHDVTVDVTWGAAVSRPCVDPRGNLEPESPLAVIMRAETARLAQRARPEVPVITRRKAPTN